MALKPRNSWSKPRFPAGQTGGLIPRFARVKRYRSDKTASEADTFQTVMEIHRRQRE